MYKVFGESFLKPKFCSTSIIGHCLKIDLWVYKTSKKELNTLNIRIMTNVELLKIIIKFRNI